ncbi:E3 ubiquitin-protein ligase rbbp6 [Cichlidogyrus casuarinus]|uniref:E3 ubiquitin-protein ligase rbbp6 n=1 Tax=Cichlidogyrus casuarinus TaxID=1844966 RepID=A0ABD2QDS8_9PLAT
MSSLVYFRFKANTKTDQIQFDGSSISVKDLKNKIRTKCCLYAADLDLKLEDSSGKVYDKDEDLIPKYANIIVRRVPKIATEGTKKKPNIYDENQRNANRPQFARSEAPNPVKSLNLANSNLSEEEKIKLMMEKSSEGTPEKAMKMKPYSIPPPNYVCHKCGQSGHWVHDCVGIIDSAGNKVDLKSRKRPTGIPSDMLLKVDAGTPGAYLSRDGTYSVPIKDAEAYAMGKKDKRPFSIEENPPYVPPTKEKVREDLKCPLCHDLFKDAVIVTCCSTTYCSICITDYAFSGKNNSQCPNCSKELTSFETNVLENRIVRNFVREYLSKQEAASVEENERFVNNRRVLKPKPSSSLLEQQTLKQPGECGNMQAENNLDPSANDTKNFAMNTMNVISGSPNHDADNFPAHVNSGASCADRKAAVAGTGIPSSGIPDLKPGTAQLGQVVNGLVIPGATGTVVQPPFIPNPLLAMSVANSLLQNQANWQLTASSILSPEEFQRRKDALLEKKRASTNLTTTDSRSAVSSEVGAESSPPSVEPGEVLENEPEEAGASKEKKAKKKKNKDNGKKSKKAKKEKKSKRTDEEKAIRKAQKEARKKSRLSLCE